MSGQSTRALRPGVGHLSEAGVARATGSGRSTVGAWLRGTHQPTVQRLERIAELSALVERLARVMEPEYLAV